MAYYAALSFFPLVLMLIRSSGWKLAQVASNMALNGVAFTLLYKILPKAPVRWRDALSGGLLVALFWQLASQLLAFVVARGSYSAYGVVGSFIALMLWVY